MRVAIVYAVAAWVIIEGAAMISAEADWDPWRIQFTLGLVVVGFPIALAFGWYWEEMSPLASSAALVRDEPADTSEVDDSGASGP